MGTFQKAFALFAAVTHAGSSSRRKCRLEDNLITEEDIYSMTKFQKNESTQIVLEKDENENVQEDNLMTVNSSNDSSEDNKVLSWNNGYNQILTLEYQENEDEIVQAATEKNF